MLSVSPIYASILFILVVMLAYRVTTFRRAEKIELGEMKSSKQMKLAVRAHGNAVENIPLALILLVILELNNLTPWLLHVFGLVLVLSRFAHAFGLSKYSGASKGRFFGTLFSWLCITLMCVVNVVIVVTR